MGLNYEKEGREKQRSAAENPLFENCSAEVVEHYLSFPTLKRRVQLSLEGEPTYVAMDFETTGFNPEVDRVIEIAAAKFRGEEVLERFESLVNPEMPIPPAVSALTGIDNRSVKNSPRLADICSKLLDFMGNNTVIGYSRLEERFLHSISRQYGSGKFENPYVDVMDLAVMLLPSLKRHRQSDLASIWDINTGREHRAGDDVATLIEVFNILLNGLYNMPLSFIGALLSHCPSEGGLSMILSRSFHERMGEGGARKLELERLVKKPREEAESSPLTGTDFPPSVEEEEVRGLFDPHGIIASEFLDYEKREEQVEMAVEALRVFQDGEILVVEAGTGTGKSLAYLVPGFLWANASNLPVVVSTRTLNLQDQLFTKDLPLLKRAFGDEDFRFTMLKGQGNYICLRRLSGLLEGKRKLSESQVAILGMLLQWIRENSSGDVSMLNISNLRGVDELVLGSSSECRENKCRFARLGSCFYHRALKRARCSQIVVVNHSLLLAGVPIPFDTLVIDEAHALEDVATEHFTREFAYRDAHHFLSSLYSPIDGEGLLGDVNSRVYDEPDSDKRRAALSAIEECTEEVEICLENLEEFFFCLSSLFHAGEEDIFDFRFSKGVMETLHYEELNEKGRRLLENLEKLVFLLSEIQGTEGEGGIEVFKMEDLLEDLAGKMSRLREFTETLDFWLGGEGEEIVKYATVSRGERFDRQALLLSPVDVGDALAEFLFEQLRAVLLTSGTLAIGDSFSFFSSRVGLDRTSRSTRMLILESSFDFQSQMQILIVQDMPEPNSPDYAGSLSAALKQVILASQGGVLSLFTNRKLMQSVYEGLVCELEREGLPLLCQQAAFSRRRTAEEFIQDDKASLFGTSSFWEGVDARGSTLRVLVVTRIPFESPRKPVFEARCERLRSEGVSDFTALSLPLAALRLKQGVGRLIRSREDRGQVVILDSRVSTRPYGRILLKSLPDAEIKRVSLDEIFKAIERFVSTNI